MRAYLFVGAVAFVGSTFHCFSESLLGQEAPYSFKGNSLGMTLQEFKKQNFQGYVYYDKKGNLTKAGKKNAIQVPTPVCTDDPTQADMRVNLGPGEVVCPEANPQFAGQRIAQVRYRFYKERLFQIESQFGSSGYIQVKQAFVAKYGPVAETGQKDFQNGFGAHWLGEISFWQQDSQVIVVSEGPDNGPGQDGCDFQDTATGNCLVPKLDASAIFRDNSLMPSAKPGAKVDF
jgi:hypothetical protein